MLANKHLGKLGFFLININDSKPDQFKFDMKYQNKLDIGDANIFIIRDEERKFKELMISYKTIYMNTYTL